MSDDYEQALLGAVLRGYQDVPKLARIVSGADFNSPQHEQIWDAIVAEHAAGGKPNPLRLLDRMGSLAHRLPGGAIYLTELDAPLIADAEFYATKVREQSIRRTVRALGERCLQAERDPDMETDDLLGNVRTWLDDVAGNRIAETPGSIQSALERVIDIAQNGSAKGLPLPWRCLDHLVDGIHPGQLVTVAARPGVGKSIMLEHIATDVARSGVWAYMVSLEMTPTEITQRTLSRTARVHLSNIRKGREWLSGSQWDSIYRAAEVINQSRIEFGDKSARTPAAIRAGAWELAQRAKRNGERLGVIVVDYVQLITTGRTNKSGASRQQLLGEVTRSLKAIAGELDVPLVMAAQLKRLNGRAPLLEDLREAGDIENDSDIVILLHEQTVEEGGQEIPTGDVDLIVAKNRQGPLGQGVAVKNGYYATIYDDEPRSA